MTTLFWLGCSRDEPRLRNKPNIEIIQDMMDQPFVKAQSEDRDSPGKAGTYLPPDHTAPRGFTPYPYRGDRTAAMANLKNPYRQDFSAELVELGGRYYAIHCAICHGSQGKGDGAVADKMILRPPTLHSQHLVGAEEPIDALFYHIIVDGQGMMRGYGAQIREEKQRWAVVNYIRHLQQQESNAEEN